jgi:TatD DNase family protein
MILTDTHCHLYLEEFSTDIDKVMENAENVGVRKFFLPAIDAKIIPDMLALEAKYPGKCFAMMGLHPCSVKEDVEKELQIVEEWLSKRSFAAVGEIGLDFHWDRSFEALQYTAFHRQIEWALHYRLPIVIHSRNATQECINIVKEHQKGDLRGIFHCFSGSYESAKEIIKAGFYLGIGGVLTYKNAGLSAVLEHIPLEHIVLETDSPYLSPVPFRGKRNESSYLKYVAEKLAEVKQLPVEEVATVTTQNAMRVFGM